jgi:transglutaminase-like putative cysteine protease
MRVRVGYHLQYESEFATPMLFNAQPRERHVHRLLEMRRTVSANGADVPVREYTDMFDNRIWRVTAPIGTLDVMCDAVADVPPTPDPVLSGLPKTPVEALPDEVLVFTLPSRYCPSDLFINDAWQMFGNIETGWEQVQAVCDWLKGNVAYVAGSSGSTTTAWDSYTARCGVCRDFAHLGVTFCRALNFPARYVAGFLPDIGVPVDPVPMDFHAWFEVYMDGAWRTFDARHNIPRTGRVLCATGRDAVDTAFATMFGGSRLSSFRVWADEVSDDFQLASTDH